MTTQFLGTRTDGTLPVGSGETIYRPARSEVQVELMQQALARAELRPEQVDYINLHGTATPSNDAAEDRAVLRVFGPDTPCSSTKGWTGHTLGAAGITEAAFVWLCLEHALIPGMLNTRRIDPNLGSGVVLNNREQPLRVALSNSFGFGGTNCSLLFGRRVA